jgi:Uma2 family endonuclease
MAMITDKRPVTPEELLKLSDEDRLELVDGQLVSTEMSGFAALVASRINRRLGNVIEPGQLGVLLTSDASYQCFADDPARIRRPDVSFLHRSRIKAEYLEGHIPIAPDLAVEVVSPNDLFYDVRRKANEYIRSGVRLVWVVNPQQREVEVYRADGTYSLVENGSSLDGEDVIPGFSCPLAELFESPRLGA